MALYYLCEKFPQRFSKFWNILIVVMLVGFGIWDQLPRYPSWEEAIRQRSWIDFRSDSDFFPALERMLPVGAMVFELPVKDYPEMGPVNDMGDYEHFRPMLHTDALRFSYGAVKGRGDDNWQKKVSSEEPREMIGDLERYGFSAILINRKAYKDRGEALSRKLLEGGAVALKENDDFLILGIHPLEKIELPPRR
jgi:phosphoglycerol transferase